LANSFINKKVDLTSTSATTLYTVPSFTTSIVKSILVSEDSGNADTITVTITDASSNVFSLFKTKFPYLLMAHQNYYQHFSITGK